MLAQSVALSHDGTASSVEKYDHTIKLVDRTRPTEEEHDQSAATDTTEAESFPNPQSTSNSLTRKLTRGSIRQELKNRKYARWSEDRLTEDSPAPSRPIRHPGVEEDPQSAGIDSDSLEPASEASKLPSRRDTLRQHRNRVKRSVAEAVHGRRTKHVRSNASSIFDVLYENQRGFYLLGVPHYSHKSLLNFDPSPWQTVTLLPSIVDITNAQLPDPSWVWADGWSNWYVDMSGDVDDEGWRYSFSFHQRSKFGWHGTHPFFTSFVRRRRWVRLRVKRSRAIARGGATTMEDAHRMNADYFTIHNVNKAASPVGTSIATGGKLKTATSGRWSRQPDGGDEDEEEDISDVSALLRRLRNAKIDRGRLASVDNFIHHGGQELFYLAENMASVVRSFVYQTSRRQLLALIRTRLEEAELREAEEGKKKHKEKATGVEARGADEVENLQRALEAADEECRRLGMTEVRDLGKAFGKNVGSGEAAADNVFESDSLGEEGRGVVAPVGQTTIFAQGQEVGEARSVCGVDHEEEHEEEGHAEEGHEEERQGDTEEEPTSLRKEKESAEDAG